MNTTPTPADDEAPDALLAALRQRLGDYGHAPPPGAWAAIRQRVAAPPLPWWRRYHALPLLALLAGLLLISVPTGEVKLPWAAERSASIAQALRRHSLTSSPSRQLNAAISAHGSTASIAGSGRSRLPAAAGPATNTEKSLSLNKVAPNKSAATSAYGPALMLKATTRAIRKPYSADTNRALPLLAPEAVATRSRQSAARYHHAGGSELTVAQATASPFMAAGLDKIKYLQGRRKTGKPVPATNSSALLAALASQHRELPGRAGRPAASASKLLAAPADSASGQLELPGLAATSPAASALLSPAELAVSLGLLVPRQAGLLLPGAALPPALVARPDSTPPPVPARRWSVLALLGPTLSYRTLGPAPVLAAGHPDFARLERPALGLGAQVQVRRVLSGRWALAVGVGYHEYATRLALAFKDSATSLRRRDTYRLLTAPVQLTYVLDAPRRRLTTGLLLGAEPGLYLGGRSTEGSDCGCGQQAYSSAGSPYRAWSLALSLGLDLRYRLGKADSRWQWLVQPTGRYVATPFVRADAVGFTQRQPFSLGVFTGFSWDVR